MSDATGHMNRPGAGPFSSSIAVDGIPCNCYINYNPNTGRVEVAKPMPPGSQDVLVKDFPDLASLRFWVEAEFRAGRMPLRL